MGSQVAPPIYQYRVVLNQEDKMINVATDMDFNVEGETKYVVSPNVTAKTKFAVCLLTAILTSKLLLITYTFNI